ncbi:MAG TPA: DUF2865 domain-containing protein [Xanthobacteraceae bacterium]|jgi:hypothetical protein|nr:DUF2865 domain-containing protein [Xanthobacteraceae bacterium]
MGLQSRRTCEFGLALALIILAGQPDAFAQGVLASLFGSSSKPSNQQATLSEPSGGGGSGRAVAFCVRLCDGRYFPMQRHAAATPVQTCAALCPASRTKVFSGSEIEHAVAADGSRYADLERAYVYRKKVVAHCGCTSRSAFGLAVMDVNTDATLRPGDVVATYDGYVAFTGGRTRDGIAHPEFTPLEPPAAKPAENRAKDGKDNRVKENRAKTNLAKEKRTKDHHPKVAKMSGAR